MAATYAKTFEVLWADLDANAHMRHSAYADYGAQARVGFLTEHGFGLTEILRHKVGPILFREDLRYLREVRANEKITVTCEAVGVSPNRKHWKIRHRILRQDGEVACTIECQGAWFDLNARKVIPPPAELQAAMDKMPRSEDYAEFTPTPQSGS